MRIERLTQKFDVALKYVHFPLHPDTPDEGRSLRELFGSDEDGIRAKNEQMRQLMEAEGLPYGTREKTYNSRLAQELGAWADTQPGGDALHDALFRAYFVYARNIGDIDILINVAQSVGLDTNEARAVLTERRFRAEVDADWEKSRRYGVTGVPTFVVGQSGVVGAQPFDVIEQLLVQSGVPVRA